MVFRYNKKYPGLCGPPEPRRFIMPRIDYHVHTAFSPDCYLVFGRETRGLPEPLLAQHPQRCLRIPIRAEARSLNLSNSVAVAVFEALRQQEFPQLLDRGSMTSW